MRVRLFHRLSCVACLTFAARGETIAPMRFSAILTTAAASVAGLASCAGGGAACPPDRACGVSSWYVNAAGGGVEGRVVVAPLTGVAGAGSDGSEALAIGQQPVLLRFDLRGIGEGSIERAVISLAPHATWRPSGSTRIIVRGVASEWTTGSTLPALESDVAGEAVLPGRTRMPVRIDVTRAMHASLDGEYTVEAIALSAEGSPVTFTGLGSDVIASRPRLEVVMR